MTKNPYLFCPNRLARSAATWGFALLLTVGGCSNNSPSSPAVESIDSNAQPPTTLPPSLSPCDALRAQVLGQVESGDLTEASGLAVSATHQGVLWTHNDSGDLASVFALAVDGRHLARFELGREIEGVDIEDMALIDGTLYLADIGDNQTVRSDISVIRFAEPDPFHPTGDPPAAEVVTLTYPDHPHDAEAFLVDPLTGSLVIITKEGGSTIESLSDTIAAPGIYVADPPIQWGLTQVLTKAGTVDLEAAHRANPNVARSVLSLGGLAQLATGADIRADGALIAVRNYGHVWLYQRPVGLSIAEALQSIPCDAPIGSELQGEAVAFLKTDGPDVVTISEGINPPINASRTG